LIRDFPDAALSGDSYRRPVRPASDLRQCFWLDFHELYNWLALLCIEFPLALPFHRDLFWIAHWNLLVLSNR
jgi:hypothetical protein